MVDWHEHIGSDPAICHGKPCIKRTRIMVSVVMDNVADGLSPEEIIREYLGLTAEDIQAVLAYAAELVREEELLPPR